ncbi:5-carboxymethyl-2-hydroxymuconate Delta-isomerase [Thalassotalea euphylliae]|uniref:5-carboxymethyl-2-hydroxymuconate Delta-isomerase n=1 Tax=Thalassotalea euphylliae TaxID=1655234 RepID=UPI00362E4833
MPHLVIEHSNDVLVQTDTKTLIETTVNAAMDSALFEVPHIKARTLDYGHIFVGGTDKGFIHVVARILSGRTIEQRQHLSSTLLKALQNMSLKELSITVEVVEMERESYSKHIC